MENELSGLHRYIAEEQQNICEISVRRNGGTVYEDYWNGFAPGDALNVMSVTKSIVSLLTGIAMDGGLIESVDQRALDFFPDYIVKRGEKTIQQVTLRHLLTMTAPYKYRSEPWTRVCTSGDWTTAALDLLGGRKGITGEFRYATLGSQILTGIISKASGMSPVECANRWLFEPLGIPDHSNAEVNSREEQMDYLTSKKPKKDLWFADPMGVNTAGWGLCLSASDMASIGQMCLEKGSFGGKRIVSEKWIEESTKPYIRCGEAFAGMSYGYMWWTIDRDKGIYAAIGDGGNVIYVEPERNMAVAVAATFQPRVFDRVQMIRQRVAPLFD